jgi:gamma-polyglutamate biosynthesis protein CapA
MKLKVFFFAVSGLIVLALGGCDLNKESKPVFNNTDLIELNDKAVSDETALFYPSQEKNIKIAFFGDLMLDRDIRTQIQKKGVGSLVVNDQKIFFDYDLNVANLEGPITSNQSISVGTVETEPAHFKFTFDPQMAEDVLKKLNINVVSLGNNHILNFGSVGLSETKDNLNKFSVNYFGGGETSDYLIRDINGLRIAFVNYNAFSLKSAEKVVAQINEIKNKSDAVIVYTHWGKEYAISENENQRKLAHQFIDAGADLIIGSHPHVVQPIEGYNGKLIFYSLGNFIFDQYFSEDVKERLAVGVSIEDNEFDFLLVPLYLEKNGELVMMEEKKRGRFLGRVAENSKVDNNVKKGIQEGKFSIDY